MSTGDPFPSLPVDFGRFRIVSLLGRGGMGAVYLAEDLRLGRRKIALKIPTRFTGEEQTKRFLREARAAAILDHPHICPVYDIGDEGDRPYLAMKFLAGRTLSREVSPRKPWDESRAIRIVATIARALHYAHEQGVIHRDLKPANVILTDDDSPIVMDFGLAKLEGATTLTYHGAIFGTPAYMSIEQARGELHEIGPWSDVYSLGVTLFELLTGRTPFVGTPVNIIAQLLADPAPNIRSLRVDVSDTVEEILARAMAKHSADRYATMHEFAEDLDSCLFRPSGGPTPPFRRAAVPPPVSREPGDRMILALPDKSAMPFSWCPRGQFMMGASANDYDGEADERPHHPVAFGAGFFLASHPVTRSQFARFADETGYATDAERGAGAFCFRDGEWRVDREINWRWPGFRQPDDHPVVAVSWYDAQRYLDWLNDVRPGHGFRLPTEAEWEYACRAGTTWRYISGNAPSGMTAHSNVAAPARRAAPTPTFADDYVFTSAVARFAPNEWGLYDMVGNVWEWCADWYDPAYYARSPRVDPVNDESGTHRVCRGGSGSNNAVVCRSSYRNRYEPERAVNILGFRIAFRSA